MEITLQKICIPNYYIKCKKQDRWTGDNQCALRGEDSRTRGRSVTVPLEFLLQHFVYTSIVMCIFHSPQELVYLRPSLHIEGFLQKLWKATISFAMSVCLIVQLHGTTKLPACEFSWNLIMWRHTHLWQYLAQLWEIFRTSCTENQNTFYVQQLFLENCVIYKIMWKSMVEPDMPQMTNIIWCMHFACWITKATRTDARTHNMHMPVHTHTTHTHTTRTCV